MKVIKTEIPDVLIIEPKVFNDERGFFFESYNKKNFQEATGIEHEFVQDNHSLSIKGVLRGMHYQVKQPQGKLVRVSYGEVYDVVVDVRRSSQTFGKWTGVVLSAENKRQLWIPEGFAHGFLVLSDKAEFQYKTTDYYSSEYERCIMWNDKELAIDWPIDGMTIVSDKDSNGELLSSVDLFE
jgi:dTDP-4-dehydrorhamnose 3,5-epimerase